MIDAVVGLLVLMLGVRGRRLELAAPSYPRLVMMLVAVAVASVLGIAVLARFGVDFFGAIHLLYLDLLVTAPLLGIAVAWQGRRAEGRGFVHYLLAAALFASGVCAAQGRFVEPFRLQLETPQVAAGGLGRPLRIGILADIQTNAVGAHEHRAIDLLLAQKPDLILIPGDIFQGTWAQFERELEPLRALLSKLDAPLGVYAVMGNCDRPRRFARLVAGTRIVWLHNDVYVVPTPTGDISIGGVSYTRHPDVERVYDVVGRDSGAGKLTILLAHDPGVVYGLGREEVPDLVIAGHTHGGQVQLPLVGALLTLSTLPARYASGLHWLDRSWWYVSRGVGLERKQAPPVRFLCPPEVTLLTVEPSGR